MFGEKGRCPVWGLLGGKPPGNVPVVPHRVPAVSLINDAVAEDLEYSRQPLRNRKAVGRMSPPKKKAYMKVVVSALLTILSMGQTLAFAAEPERVDSTRSGVQRVLFRPDAFRRSIALEATRAALPIPRPGSNVLLMLQRDRQSRTGARRHPVLIGTLVGFGAGAGLGVAVGQNGGIADWSAGFSGLVLGGIGAGVGAIIGRVLE